MYVLKRYTRMSAYIVLLYYVGNAIESMPRDLEFVRSFCSSLFSNRFLFSRRKTTNYATPFVAIWVPRKPMSFSRNTLIRVKWVSLHLHPATPTRSWMIQTFRSSRLFKLLSRTLSLPIQVSLTIPLSTRLKVS